MESVPPENVSIIKEWFEENYQNLPEGAILVQSSSGQVWPYPALLYGRGNWSAIDLLFTLPDIPMTFMNEIDGEAYRVQITNVYTSKEIKNNEDNSNNQGNNRLKSRSKSLLKLIESKEQEQREKERERESNKGMQRSNSILSLSEFLATYDLSESISSIINLSGVSMKNARDIDSKQNSLVQTLKKEDEFDLTKIKDRYDQRRQMRANHPSLKVGELIYLKALDNNNNVHPGIFAFARKTPEETGIFAINFRDQETNFLLDLTNLLGEEGNSNSICKIVDWTNNSPGELYFLRELTQSHVNRK